MSTAAPRTLPVRIQGGVRVVCSANLADMTTYVLLEQDDWFESEMAFVRAYAGPAMNMIDVGANHGVYGLTFASKLEGVGHVWAFEPASSPFSMLASSVAENGFENVMTPLQCGLSNRTGTAELYVSEASELSSLHQATDRTETIELDTLDTFVAAHCRGATIDFVKLDAEGEELNILAGGARFFAEQSPVVMFEIKHGAVVNDGLWTRLIELGYGLYRLIPGLNVLAPVDPATTFESFQLNLFAVKPDRALVLSRRGLLSFDAGFSDKGQPHLIWAETMRTHPYCQPVLAEWNENMRRGGNALAADHAWALNAYLSSAEPSLLAGHRIALLVGAAATWERLVRQEPAHLSFSFCLARANVDLGRRSAALDQLRRIRTTIESSGTNGFRLPFLPLLPTFDRREVSIDGYGEWLFASIMEASELWSWFSSYFAPDSHERLLRLAGNSHTSPGMYRRLVLATLRAGKPLVQEAFAPILQTTTANLNGEAFSDMKSALARRESAVSRG